MAYMRDNTGQRLDEIEVADVTTVTALVPGEVADAVDGHVPGSSLAFAQYGSATSTTDTANGLAISGLLVNVVGAGRPVEITWRFPGVYHSVAGVATVLAMAYQKAGVYQGYLPHIVNASSPWTDKQVGPLSLSHQMVLDDGVTYSFYPMFKPAAAGTSTIPSNGVVIQTMSVVSR